MSGSAAEQTVEGKIVLSLFEYRRFKDNYVCPAGMTQQGLADETGEDRSYVNRRLKLLMEGGFVKSEKRHIEKGRRQKQTYWLTIKGESLANQLKKAPTAAVAEKDEHDDDPEPFKGRFVDGPRPAGA